jgi:hypothetical protein
MGAWLERVVFSSQDAALPFATSDYRTRQLALTEANFNPALQASCSIPFMLKAVHNIPGAPKGAYQDGGITDYHLHLDEGNKHLAARRFPEAQAEFDAALRLIPNDPAATASNIVMHESLFRFGIASFMIEQVAFLLLPLVLFRLFRSTNPTAAALMVALAVASVPIALVSVGHRLDALALLTDSRFSQAFAPDQLQAMAKLSLQAYGNGLLVTSLFWGLWLLPFGYLVLKSGFLPKLLGVLLMLGCLGYMVNVFGELLVPHYSDTLVSNYAGIPAAIGEIGTCLWLLLVGARRPKNGAA